MTKKGTWKVAAVREGRKYFTAVAERDGRFWFLRVVGRPELVTQTVRLDQAEDMVRDLIATWDDVPADSIDVRIEPRVDKIIDEATDALWRVRLVESVGAALSRSLAVELVRDRDLSMRDAGKVLGLSHQRVAQLIEEHEALAGAKRPRLEDYVRQVAKLAAPGAVTIRAGDDTAKVEQARMLTTHAPAADRAAMRHPTTGRFAQAASKRTGATLHKKR